MISIATRAEALARSAHADQVDKAGLPYADHPARVAARVRISAPGDESAEAVAWLHDVGRVLRLVDRLLQPVVQRQQSM